MAGWQRSLAALPEDLSSIASTHMDANNWLVLVPGDWMPFSGLHGPCSWCTDLCVDKIPRLIK